MHIENVWPRQWLAEHRVCSWLWCSRLVTLCWGSRPALIQPSAGLLLFPKFTSSPAPNTWPVMPTLHAWHWLALLTSGHVFFAWHYWSQSIPVSPSSRPWVTGLRKHQTWPSEHVASKASQDGLGLLQSIRCQEPAQQGCWGYGLWVIHIQESQWGLNRVSYDFLELVYSPTSHFTGSSSGTHSTEREERSFMRSFLPHIPSQGIKVIILW